MVCIGLLLGVYPASSESADVDVKSLKTIGTQVPGSRPGNLFVEGPDFSIIYHTLSTTLGIGDRAYFVASTTDEGESLWMESSPGGDLVLLAKVGDVAPDMDPGTTFARMTAFYNSIRPVGNGNIIFNVVLEGDSYSGPAIYFRSAATGAIRLLIRDDEPVPGTSTEFFQIDTYYRYPQQGNDGRFFMEALVSGTGVTTANDEGIWTWTLGGPKELIIREGNSAPGASNGEVIESIVRFSRNNLDNVAYTADLTGPGTDASNSKAIFVGTPTFGGQSIAIRAGDPAPGVEADSVFTTILNLISLGNDGGINFTSKLSGPNVADPDAYTRWSMAPGQDPQLVPSPPIVPSVNQGDPAPGTSAGVTFSTILYQFSAGPGEWHVFAYLAGPGVDGSNYFGIWTGPPQNLRLVARTGSQLPTGFGIPNLATITNSVVGRVVFIGEAAGERSLWLLEPEGTLRELFREGDPVLVAGENRIIDYISFRVTSSRRLFEFSETGRFVVKLSFTDGSDGIFAVTPLPVTSQPDRVTACINAALKAALIKKIKKLKKKIKRAKRSRKIAKAKKLKKKMKKLKRKLAALPC